MTDLETSGSVPAPAPVVPEVSNIEEVSVAGIVERVRLALEQGWRLVTLTCMDRGEQFEILYHFDDNLTLHNIRVYVGRNEELPSVSGVCLASFLVENEIKELFGVKITNIAIDYADRLYLVDEGDVTPMAKVIGA